MQISLVFLQIICLIQLNKQLFTNAATMVHQSRTPTTRSTSKPVTSTQDGEIVYDYNEIGNMTNLVQPINIPAVNNSAALVQTTTITLNPRVQINETINNIEAYIPELQTEVSKINRIDFSNCNAGACNDACTHLKIDLLGLDDFVCFALKLVSCNSELSAFVKIGNLTIYNDQFSITNPHCFINYEVPNSMRMFNVRFYFDNMVITADKVLVACVTMELNMSQLYSFSTSLGCFELSNQ